MTGLSQAILDKIEDLIREEVECAIDAEREACAKIAEELGGRRGMDSDSIAFAIRERGTEKRYLPSPDEVPKWTELGLL